MNRRILTLALVACALTPAMAGVRQLSLQQLTQGAQSIVRGQITSATPRWEQGVILTKVKVRVDEWLKGSGGQTITLNYPGGTIGDITMNTGESPRMRVGEDVILFVRKGVSPCEVYGWFRGKYTVVNGQVRELRNTSVASFQNKIQRYVRSGR